MCMENPTISTEERLVTQWTEPQHQSSSLDARQRLQIIGGSLVLFALALGMGIWQHAYNYYLAAAGIVCASVAVLTQGMHKHSGRQISVTSTRFMIGDTVYPIADLAGFWLRQDDGVLVISLEYKKPSLVPPTCFFPTLDEQEVRSVLTGVMPELEPREEHFSEGIGRYFKL